ncbi:hypothetical protein GNY06_07475 [Elizabethkingia argentiflava]|uniref:C-type lysozyme inhibitor domain-containing protein n=1 Tax=Elizabethkingia argenteiflava TaxID=2681556 RepID=A0A845PW69_9FLAO|nr:MliC family protein [Elizabethkingia argenteiflava]NAW51221.1 hypothetical protein [Elizabethkingia argenteiflava]
MKKVFLIISGLALTICACNSKKEKVDTDTLNTNAAPQVEEKVSTKIPINNEGPLYVSSDNQYRFRIISGVKGEGDSAQFTDNIIIRNENDGRVYDMKLVPTASGDKYEDKEGNYFWTKEDDFMFGKGDNVVAEGKISTQASPH